MRGRLLVLLRDWLVVLRRRGLRSLLHGRRLTVLTGVVPLPLRLSCDGVHDGVL